MNNTPDPENNTPDNENKDLQKEIETVTPDDNMEPVPSKEDLEEKKDAE